MRENNVHCDSSRSVVIDVLMDTEAPEIPDNYDRYRSVKQLYRLIANLPDSQLTDITILTAIEFMNNIHIHHFLDEWERINSRNKD